MPAIPRNGSGPHEGVKLRLPGPRPHRIVGDENGNVQGHRGSDQAGRVRQLRRRRPVLPRRSAVRVDDSVILAVGESVTPILPSSGSAQPGRHAGGGPSHARASRSKILNAGGDLISGASNVSNSMGFGQESGAQHRRPLMGGGRWESLQGAVYLQRHFCRAAQQQRRPCV